MYHALYRKYRPQNFDDVVGQNIIIKTLKNSIKNNHFSHAYMFFGPRGTGKTTISKIFARAVNCLDNSDGCACGKCKNCLYSYEKECIDIIEIDAASNNGVDEIRELRNKVSLVPTELKYKVYIIDEVHMLSIGAFNALLKTLEEPPEHVIFILATTDPQKVPETIVSRCQCFSFKRISLNMLVERLKKVCENENISIEEKVLEEIAFVSDGGMRDALGILDKLRSYTDNTITMDDFIDLNGLLTINEIHNFCDYIFDSDVSNILKFIDEINNSGKNLIQVLSQIMYYLRDIIVDFYVNSKNIEYDIESVQKLINLINEKMFDIKKSGNTKVYIEMLILEYVNDIKGDKIISREIISVSNDRMKDNNIVATQEKEDNVNVISNNEIDNDSIISTDNYQNNNKTNIKTISNISNPIVNIDDIIRIRVNNTFAKADKKKLKEFQEKLKVLNDYTFDQNIGYLVCQLLDAKFRVASEDSIVISYEYDSIVEQNIISLDKLTDIYNQLTGMNIKFAIISDEIWEKKKNEYIDCIKNGSHYDIIDEPVPQLEDLVEEKDKSDIITNSAIELFGDIVEFE